MKKAILVAVILLLTAPVEADLSRDGAEEIAQMALKGAFVSGKCAGEWEVYAQGKARCQIYREATMDKKEIAIHEAGHAVANARLEIQQHSLTIIPGSDFAGLSSSEFNVWSEEDAERQVKSCCAGYAALVAHEYSKEEARVGAQDDFDKVEELIEEYGLGGTLDEWKSRTIKMMSELENIRAVKHLADELLQCEKLDGDTVEVLIEVADGISTEDEYERFKVMKNFANPPSHV